MDVAGIVVLMDPLLDSDEYEWVMSQGYRTFKIYKVSEILTLKHHLKGFFLFLENPRMRFDIKAFASYIKTIGGLSLIREKDSNKVLAFDIQNISIANGFMHNDYPFLLKVSLWEEAPKIDVPDIYMLAHSRPEYFRLTMNSLLYSFGKEQSGYPNIKIFLNDPTPELFSAVCEYQQKYSMIEWYKSDVNVKFKAMRAMIDYFNPNIFLYAEEDFILPETVHGDYPFWPQQFAQIASKGGLAGWRSNNLPKSFYNPFWVSKLFMKPPTAGQTFDYRWEINYGPDRMVPGHLIALKGSIYKYIDNPLTKPAVDHNLSASTLFEATPTTFGYHIGHNNAFDYADYANKAHLPDYHGAFSVVDHKGEKHSMCVK